MVLFIGHLEGRTLVSVALTDQMQLGLAHLAQERGTSPQRELRRILDEAAGADIVLAKGVGLADSLRHRWVPVMNSLVVRGTTLANSARAEVKVELELDDVLGLIVQEYLAK